MPDLDQIHREQQRSMDALIATFRAELELIVSKAQARAAGYLQKKLSITNGVIDRTASNNRILRSLDTVLAREMNDLGYGALVQSFVGEFPGQLPYLKDTIQALSDQMKTPLPAWKLGATDNAALASLQVNIAGGLDMVVEGVARTAVQNVLLTVGGTKFSDLVETLAEKFNATTARATSLADTAMQVWYRTATDRAFQSIEVDLPSKEIRYRYTLGPDDRRTRPFCHHLITETKEGKNWTRAEIGEMNNGQLPNVLLTGGGHGCRHQWLMAVN